MTAEPGLLPSSVAAFTEALHGERGSLDAWLEVNDEREVRAHVEAYARANVEHAVAPLQAEIEALRAEVERLTFEMERLQQQYDERTACMIVHRGSALACSDAVRSAYSDEHHRAERLAEALRRYRNEVPLGHQPHMLAHVVDDMLNPTAAQEGKESFWPKLPGSGGPDWTGHD